MRVQLVPLFFHAGELLRVGALDNARENGYNRAGCGEHMRKRIRAWRAILSYGGALSQVERLNCYIRVRVYADMGTYARGYENH